MKFKDLSNYFEKIEATDSRLEMTDILAELYKKANEQEQSKISYLLVGRVAPMFIPIEFNVATKLLLRVLEGVSMAGGSKMDVKKKFDKLGDLGLVAEEIVTKVVKRGKGLSVSEVYEQLWEIAMVSGQGSVDLRTQMMHKLLVGLSPIEAKYVMRILSQRLRLGCSSKTVLDAISVAIKGDKSDRDEIERAFGVCSDLGYVVSTYLKFGVAGMEKIDIVPGVPVAAMLVQREKDAESIIARIAHPIVQPKYDGLRCQIHIAKEDGSGFEDRVWWKYWGTQESQQQGLFGDQIKEKRIRLFSRNLEDMTEMFPEVVEAAGKLDVESAVLDSEVIGFNEETGEFYQFQETMIRKRKYDIGGAAAKVPVRAFVFDVLYIDGRSLIKKSNAERVKIVEDRIPKEGTIEVSSNYSVSSAKELNKIFDKNISEGLEGVIVKDPDSNYRPGARIYDWMKMKRAFQGNLADTVDVVILGYYFGRGRQSSFGIGAILGGVYDSDKDEFVSIAKIGTGVTDDQWKMIKSDLDEIKSDKMPKRYDVDKSLYPDQWVYPEIVATVEADEITRSPIHTAGKNGGESGYALRFPRLKDWKRDKAAEDATSVKEVKEMAKISGKGK